jgi:hypothetical protein
MRSPKYSITRVPLGMRLAAKTPLPWIFELRTLIQGLVRISGIATEHSLSFEQTSQTE